MDCIPSFLHDSPGEMGRDDTPWSLSAAEPFPQPLGPVRDTQLLPASSQVAEGQGGTTRCAGPGAPARQTNRWELLFPPAGSGPATPGPSQGCLAGLCPTLCPGCALSSPSPTDRHVNLTATCGRRIALLRADTPYSRVSPTQMLLYANHLHSHHRRQRP